MYETLAYGVKVAISVDVIFKGCHGCQIDGYIVSERDSPDILDVCLLAHNGYDHRGRKLLIDDVGAPLSGSDKDPDREFFLRHLMAEAQKPENRIELEQAWFEWRAWERHEACCMAGAA